MNLIDTTPEFLYGRGGATAAVAPVTISTRIIRGVRIKALAGNSDIVYVGGLGVTVLTGFELSAGEEVLIKIDDPAKVGVVASPSQNQQQTISISGSVTGDTFKLGIDGETTGPITEDDIAGDIEALLEALTTIGASDVTVTGGPGPGTDWVVEWVGVYAGINRPLLVVSEAGQNEVQTVPINSSVISGNFTLTYAGQTTGTIEWDDDATAVKTALELLSNVDLVAVTGGPGPGTDWVVEFQGTLARTDVALMTGDGTALVGSWTTITVVETTPADPGENEVQTVSIDNATTSGTFTLTYSGQTTGTIEWDADATAIKTALELLSNIDLVAVTGGPGPSTDWVVEFQGSLVRTDVALMTGDGTSLVGGSTTVTIVETTAGDAGQNEQQTVPIDNANTSGTFTLTYAGQTTGTIEWDADAAAVKTALELLSNIDQVAVTGGPGPSTDWVVEFQGTLERTDVALMTGDGTLLVGGSTAITVVETAAGNADPVVVVTQTQDAALESQFSWLCN